MISILHRSATALTTSAVAGALLTVLVAAPAPAVASSSVPVRAEAAPPDPVAPYLAPGRGSSPDPAQVMKATGVRWFTLAAVRTRGACTPRWDGVRPLAGGKDEAAVRAVRQAGGDVVVAFGGGPEGHPRTLESGCSDARSLAQAYQQVIDAYALRAVEVGLGKAAHRDAGVRQKTIDALKLVRAANPALTLYVTLPTGTYGPETAMIEAAAQQGLAPDAWSVRTFSFGRPGRGKEMDLLTLQAVEGLTDRLVAAYGYSEEEAHARAGVSSMNGITHGGEVVTVQDFRSLVDYARVQKLGRLTFWAVNRDRPCPGRYLADDACSGVNQRDWAYTRALAGYRRT